MASTQLLHGTTLRCTGRRLYHRMAMAHRRAAAPHATHAPVQQPTQQQRSTAHAAGMREAWRIEKPGAIADLVLVQEPLPELQPGQAQVAVRAIGLNFADVFSCLGLYSAFTKAGAGIPGLEFSGVITAIHPQPQPIVAPAVHPPDVKPLAVGDRVVGVIRFGAFAASLNIDARYLKRIPEGWSFEQAAAFPVQAITALYALKQLGGLRRGGSVLVHSAAGGVGLAALHIAERMGAGHVLGTVRSRTKASLLEQAFGSSSHAGSSSVAPGSSADKPGSSGMAPGSSGVSQLTNHLTTQPTNEPTSSSGSRQGPSSPTYEFMVRGEGAGVGAGDELLARGGAFLKAHGLEGFDVILDSLQGAVFHAGYDLLAPTGRIILFGAAALTPGVGARLTPSLSAFSFTNLRALWSLVVGYLTRPKLDVLNLPGDNKSVMGFNLIWLYAKTELFNELYDELEALQLPPPLVGTSLPFAQLPAALELLQSGDSVGKVVVVVPPGPGP